MAEREVDIAILGAGSAGLSAFRAASRHTDSVALIDPGPLGTTCARVGCMPSKLLIAAAEAAHAVHEAPLFGVHPGPLRIDGREVMARVRSERDRFVGFVLDDIAAIEARHRIEGRARFTGPQRLRVDLNDGGTLDLHARRVVIATGSHPALPAEWRAALGERLIVNDDVFDWQDLPASIAVVGAGTIGLELAQALHRLGVRVRLLGRGTKVGPLSDPELQALGATVFEAALPLQREAAVTSVEREGGGVRVRWHTPQGEHEESFDLLLAATGRTPNIEALAPAAAGLTLDEHGVPAFDPHTLQIGRGPVFIAGDVNVDRPLLHEAADEGLIAGDSAGRSLTAGLDALPPQPRRTPLAIVFSDPQIALAGLSHRQLCAAGTRFGTGRVSFANQGRSRVIARNVGALHVYGELGTRRLLGAELLGPAAEHLAHLLAWSIQRGETVDAALAQPFYHPVIEEGLRTALRELRKALDARATQPCEGCEPGE
ncbi:dihydrolipoyl dehydrogenase [Rivibacter subsaxonicus]|uniref:Dihydrolipoamide dehydrogenase n=1 Tax=Rivibacter subsaxonicus TaxID=457575 RepID=A0A4V2FTE2_9BURK|nr:dihydrolipoyl dehydrogenase [Rivibacter subsaxonicus]RZT97825.1 dihydrolipoamide dehydrogenase [Rivibacter subsaxonicus]